MDAAVFQRASVPNAGEPIPRRIEKRARLKGERSSGGRDRRDSVSRNGYPENIFEIIRLHAFIFRRE
jgi:hypothetical protein